MNDTGRQKKGGEEVHIGFDIEGEFGFSVLRFHEVSSRLEVQQIKT